MKLKTLALGLLLVASPAFAADIDGKWSGSLDTPGGAMAVSYMFTSDGNKFTGSTTSPDGTAIAITDGKIDGNKITFTLTLDFGAGPTTFNYTGVVSPTGLQLHTSFMDMPLDFALTKS